MGVSSALEVPSTTGHVHAQVLILLIFSCRVNYFTVVKRPLEILLQLRCMKLASIDNIARFIAYVFDNRSNTWVLRHWLAMLR